MLFGSLDVTHLLVASRAACTCCGAERCWQAGRNPGPKPWAETLAIMGWRQSNDRQRQVWRKIRRQLDFMGAA